VPVVPLVQPVQLVQAQVPAGRLQMFGQVNRALPVLQELQARQELEQLQVVPHLIHGLVLQALQEQQVQLVLPELEQHQEQPEHQIQEQQEIQDLLLQRQIIHQPKYTLTRRLP
jgi:hypothetical protein